MAELNFPASPTDGQIYGNFIWSAATGAWLARPQPQSVAVSSPTAPTSPVVNTLWYNTNDGNTYIYNYDGDSYQWVQLKSDATLSSTLGSRVDALDYGANVNYLLNADFAINQRGFTSTTTNDAYGFDRWKLGTSGGTTTYSAQTFTPGSAPIAGFEAINYARIVTSGQSAVGDYAGLRQPIEDARTLAGQTVTVSFYARAATGTPKVAICLEQNFGSGGSGGVQTFGGLVTLSTSWARYSVNVTVPSIAGKTIGTNSYIQAWLFASAGSNLTAYAGSLGIQNTSIDVWGVQVQQGLTATAFHRSSPTIQGELAACQRYYETGNFGMQEDRSGKRGSVVSFAVSKRITPTLTTYDNAGTINCITTKSGYLSTNTDGITGYLTDIWPNGFAVYDYTNAANYGKYFSWRVSAEL